MFGQMSNGRRMRERRSPFGDLVVMVLDLYPSRRSSYTRTLIVSALFFLIAVVAAVWLYSQMPVRVPVQWDRLSHVMGTMPRFWGAALPALIILALDLLTPLLPLLSLRRFEITPLVHVYGIVMLAIQGVLLVGGLCVLLCWSMPVIRCRRRPLRCWGSACC
jgi:hypothetical protein